MHRIDQSSNKKPCRRLKDKKYSTKSVKASWSAGELTEKAFWSQWLLRLQWLAVSAKGKLKQRTWMGSRPPLNLKRLVGRTQSHVCLSEFVKQVWPLLQCATYVWLVRSLLCFSGTTSAGASTLSSLQLDVSRSKAGFAGRSFKMNTQRFATHTQ